MKKFFAGLFVFAILIIYPFTLVTTAVKYAVFKPEVIKQIIHRSQVAEHLPALIAETSSEQPGTNATETDTALSTGQTAELIESSLNPEDVYAITDQVVDAAAVWLGTDQPIEELNIRISTDPVKSQLLEASHGEADLSFLPDELTTTDLLSQSGSVGPGQLKDWNAQLNQARTSVRQIFWFIWVGWGIIIFSLLMIAALRHKPLYSLFGWYGWTLILMTLECIPLVLILWIAPRWLLPWISGSTSATVIEIIDRALAATMRYLLLPVGLVMGGTMLLGIACLVVRAILKHRQQPVVPTATISQL